MTLKHQQIDRILCLFGYVLDIATPQPRLSIMYTQFDDLGFGDTGYNGADYPTPILDKLANNDAIKINFHYTENVCNYLQ